MSVRVGSDILLTGLPRSGTNLTCALLNRVPQTVALAEPMDVAELARAGSRVQALWLIERFLRRQRLSLLQDRVAVTRHSGGAVRDNFFAAEPGADGLRHSSSDRGAIMFDKSLDPDFRLIVKHPAVFTGLLPELAESFPCFALIRNPLPVLASWNSNRIPVREGRIPAAEGVDSGLRKALDAIHSREARQIFVLDWFFRRFRDALPEAHLIRYESLVASRGQALSVLSPAAAALDEPLASRNASPLYGWAGLSELTARLLDSDGAYWQYYRRDDVALLFQAALEHDRAGDPRSGASA